MKTTLLILCCVVTALVAHAEDALPILPDRPYHAVIIPAEIAKPRLFRLGETISDAWTPTIEQVALAEKRIAEFLATAPEAEGISPVQRRLRTRVRDQPEKYVREYVGIVRAGRRAICCVGNAAQHFGDSDVWRRGICYSYDAQATWQIDYDLADDVCRFFIYDDGTV